MKVNILAVHGWQLGHISFSFSFIFFIFIFWFRGRARGQVIGLLLQLHAYYTTHRFSLSFLAINLGYIISSSALDVQ